MIHACRDRSILVLAALLLVPKRGVRAHHWPYGDMPPVEGVADARIEKIVLHRRAPRRANNIF